MTEYSANKTCDLIITKQLKTLYFEDRKVVATTDGLILTSDYNAPNIGKIRNIIATNEDLYEGRFLGVNLSIKRVAEDIISKHLQQETRRAIGDKARNLENDSDIAVKLKGLLQRCVTLDASDIHVEVYRNQTLIKPRVDGVRILLQDYPDAEEGMSLISFLLISGYASDKDDDFVETDINNANLEEVLFCPSLEENGETIERNTLWRVAYIPAPDGGKLTLRWLNRFDTVPTFEQLGHEPSHIAEFNRFTKLASGIMLICGVTGSGKSTTAASAISLIDSVENTIHTLEDPIEFNLSGVMQTLIRPTKNINSKSNIKQTQAQLSKALLRHDTDVEFHGEMRDYEAGIEVASKGETGQLVISTLHTSSAPGAGPRLIEMMKVPKEVVTAPGVMRLWVYQALVRKLCKECRLTADKAINYYKTNHKLAELESLTKLLEHLPNLLDEDALTKLRFYNPEGCSHCICGEKGRLPLVEMVVIDDNDREYLQRKDYLGWRDALTAKGFKTVRDHAISRIARGEIDPRSADDKLNDKLIPVSSSDVYGSFSRDFSRFES